MKKKIFLLALPAMILGGCEFDINSLMFWKTENNENSQENQGKTNENEQENEPAKFSDVFEFNDQYTAHSEMIGEAVNSKKEKPRSIYNYKMEYKKNGKNLGYTKSEDVKYLVGTAAQFVELIDSEDVDESNVGDYIKELCEENSCEYKFENGTYIIETDKYGSECYYESKEGQLFPTVWSKCNDPESQDYGKYVGTTYLLEQYYDPFDGITDYAEYFHFNKEKSRYEFDISKGFESELLTDENESMQYMYVYVKNGLVSSMEYDVTIYNPGGLEHDIMKVTFEKGSSLALPPVSQRAPLCEHKNISEMYSCYASSGDKHYHAKYCSDCGSTVCMEECAFEEGTCTVCGHELSETKYYLDGEGNRLLYIYVNAVTKKINHVGKACDYDLLSSDEYEYVDKIVFNDQCIFDGDYYGKSIELFTYNGINYCFFEAYDTNGADTYYLLENITYSLSEEEGDRRTKYIITITGENMVKFSIGEVYTE